MKIIRRNFAVSDLVNLSGYFALGNKRRMGALDLAHIGLGASDASGKITLRNTVLSTPDCQLHCA